MKSIFIYSDYRKFIKDAIEEKRAKNPQYSCRCAANRMGITSGTLTRILNGTRHAGAGALKRLVDYLGLKKREAEYFSLIARFESIKDENKRRACYQKILRMRAECHKQVSKEHYRFFEQWYHVALFELLRTGRFTGDCASLGARLIPPVSPFKTRKALDILKRLEYLRGSGDGPYNLTQSFLTTGDIWESAAIHAFQVAMAQLGARALDALPKEQRDFSTLTMALSSQEFEKVREVIKKARLEIATIEGNCTAPDRVYQINFQCFPLSVEKGKDPHHDEE